MLGKHIPANFHFSVFCPHGHGHVKEYEKLSDIEYERSGRQACNEMIKDIINPLKDYLFQRFWFGLQSPQQTMSQQQSMPT